MGDLVGDPREIGTGGLKGINRLQQSSTDDRRQRGSGRWGHNMSQAQLALYISSMYGNLSGVGINTNPNYGASKYDKEVTTLSEYNDLNEVRALNLGALTKLGAGIGKAVTTAGTTFLDGTMGLVYGLGAVGKSALTEDHPWQLDIARLWDNRFSNAMREFGELMEQILPNYQTREEQQNEWYQNIGTANFWADFLKLIGFIVGAFYSGSAWTKGLKAIGAISLAGGASMLGAALSAVNEGRIEANNNSNDWAKMETQRAHDGVVNNLVKLGYSKEYAEAYWNDNNQGITEDINHRKANMGLIDLAINVPLLMADNLLTFGKLYARGFDSAKRASASQVLGSFLDRFKKGVSEASKELATKEAGKQVVKEGGQYAWKKITALDAFKTGGKRFLTEGLEEMSQMWAAETAGVSQQLDSPDSYYRALTDPQALKDTKGFIKGITEGFANSYGDLSKYQDFIMGGLSGILGTPTFGRSQNKGSETWLGKGKFVGVSGGLVGAFTDASYLNRIGEEAIAGMNEYIQNYKKNFESRARHFAASTAFTDAMNGWSAANNSFEEHNARDNEDFTAAARFASVGKLQDYKDLVNLDFENISDEELNKIALETINPQTNKPLWANADGTLMSSTEDGRKKMREELAKKRDSILEGIDLYEKCVGQMRSISGIEDNDDAVRELAWLKWKMNRFATRKLQLTEESKDFIQKIISSLASVNGHLDVGIAALGLISDTTSKNENDINRAKSNKATLISYENQRNQNQAFIDILTSWLHNPVQVKELTLEGKDILLSEDFYDDLVVNTGMTYDEYKTVTLNLLDLDKLNTIYKQFDDRLKYYLDDSQKAEKTSTKATSTNKKESTLENNQPEVLNGIYEEDDNLEAARVAREPNPVATPVNPVQEKIDGQHAKIDGEVTEQQQINNAVDVKNLVNTIKTASQYHQLLELGNLELINAEIDDLEKTTPNHTAVHARNIDKALDLLFDSLGNALQDHPEIWNLIKYVSDVSESLDDFKDKLISIPDILIGEAMGFSVDAQGSEYWNTVVPQIQLTLRDAITKVVENNNTTPTITTLNTPKPTTPETTGADDTSKVPPLGSTNLENVEADPAIQEFITKSKANGIEDNAIINAAKLLNYDENKVRQLLKLWNELHQETLVTEETTAITPQYSSELYTDTTTQEGDVTTQVPAEQTSSQEYQFFRANTTEYPIHMQLSERDGTFNYDAWVDAQNWSPELKQSLKVRHKHLVASGAFKRVSNGEVKKGAEVTFVTYADINREAGDLVVFMLDSNGNIIGDLPSSLDTNAMKNYPGLEELLTEIANKSDKGNKDYTHNVKSHVNKIMIGRPEFTNIIQSIQEINSNLPIGICIDKSNKTIATSNKDRAPIVDLGDILSPLNPKRGQIYVLVPNGAVGSKGGHTAVLCTVPKVGPQISGTVIRDRIVEAVEKLVKAQTYSDLVKATLELESYVWLPNLHVNAYNAKGLMSSKNNEGPILRITIREYNETNNTYLDLIEGGLRPTAPNAIGALMNVLQGRSINIDITKINTAEGNELYKPIVKTNLPTGIETTVNDWFTINPIVGGVELKGTSPRTTSTNPNVHQTTELSYTLDNGKTITLDTQHNKVFIDNVELSPVPVTDPKHINSVVNRAYAKMFVDSHPTAFKIGNVVQTPYGWYDVANKKLVPQPASELPLQKIGVFSRTDSNDSQQTQLEAKHKEEEENGKSNPDVLGLATINGNTEDILFSELLDAQLFGYGESLTKTSDINDIAKAIEDWRNSDDYYREEDLNMDVPLFNKEKELKWLARVLPQVTENDRVQLVEGLINNRAWGMFSNGIMYLSNLAAQGTTYHEAFHVVSQTLLSSKERELLYKTASKVYGNDSNRGLEEKLAEDFRRYTLMNEEPDGRLKKFFTRLWNTIKAVFSNRAKLEKLFYDINLGIYVGRAFNAKYSQGNVNQQELNNNKNTYYRDADFTLSTKEDFQRVLDGTVNSASYPSAKARANALGSMLDYWQTLGYKVKTTKDAATKHYKVTSVTESYDPNGLGNIQSVLASNLARQKRYDYSNLTAEQLDYLHNSGSHSMTREEYELLSTAERQQYFDCMGV